MNVNRYTTDRDIRDQYVLPALAEWASDFDVDAIVTEVIRRSDHDGVGYVVDLSDREFWTLVQAHELFIATPVSGDRWTIGPSAHDHVHVPVPGLDGVEVCTVCGDSRIVEG